MVTTKAGQGKVSPKERFLRLIAILNPHRLGLPGRSWWRENWRTIPVRLPRIQRYLNRREKWLLGLGIVLLDIGIILLIYRSMTTEIRLVPDQNAVWSEVTVGEVGRPLPGLEVTDVDKTISSLLFRPLLQENSDGQLQPDLAQSIETSDRQTYTITLKSGQFWQDQKPITSADVKKTIEYWQDASLAPERSSFWQEVSVELPNDQVIILKLKQPYALLPYLLTDGIMPAHLDLPNLEQQLVGSSQYRFVPSHNLADKFNRGVTKLHFERLSGAGQTSLKTIDLIVAPTIERATQEFTHQHAIALSSDNPPSTTIKNAKQAEYNQQKQLMLLFRTDHELFKDKGTRQQIRDGKPFNTPKTASLIVQNEPSYVSAAKQLVTDWQAKGLTIQLNVLDPGDLTDRLSNGQFDLALIGMPATWQHDPYLFLHSSQQKADGLNWSRISDPSLDAALVKLRTDGLPGKNDAPQKDLQVIINDLVPYITLKPMPAEYFLTTKTELKFSSPSGYDQNDRFRSVTQSAILHPERVKKTAK